MTVAFPFSKVEIRDPPEGSLYVSKAAVLGAAVVGVKYGKVDLDKVSSIGIRTMTTPDRVAITVHLKDGSAGSYEVERQSRQEVLELLQPVATQLGIRIVDEAAGAGVLPDGQLRLLAGSCVTYRFGFAPGASRVLAGALSFQPVRARRLRPAHRRPSPVRARTRMPP